MRKPYADIGLSDSYNEALGAMRYCKSVRNQYAHSHWREDDGWLMFGEMDKAAKSFAVKELAVPYIPIDLQTIKLQNKYFGYAI
jgi:hypothetical protein